MTRKRTAPHPRRPGTVVALGASAGGLESLGRLLAGLPRNFPAPVLVALHLDPHHRSQAVPLLQNRTKMRVEKARGGAEAKPGTVYVAPPNRHLELHAGKLRLTHAPRVNFSRPSIDLLFASVAVDCGPAAIVVVLSGAGMDGSESLAGVKARGGIAVAEDLSTAGFPGMPEAAVRTGMCDAVLPITQIPAFLVRAATHRVSISEGQWLRMLTIVERRTGMRFAKYRSTTLHRRLQQRLAARGCRTMAAYLRTLKSDPAEVNRLHAAFLIKVSSFLRDPSSWRAVAREVARLAGQRTEVRAWSAGCATGAEPYTMALTLARALGIGQGVHWKVFATDVDEGALKVARAGRYTDEQLQGISPDDLARYFVRDGGGWRVGQALRSRVVFGSHDLLHDPPLTGIDILACRNVLIYFNPEEKLRTLRRLALALNPAGILFLGRAEVGAPPGFDRIGSTTLFRRTLLHGMMAPRKSTPGPADDRARDEGRSSRGRHERLARAGKPATGVRVSAQQDLNEELQSRNEELETVNEELQSLNDEMSTMEDEMRGLGEQSRVANDFLRLLLDTSSDVLIACDAENRVTFWNKAAIKRFRLSPAQAVGGELFDLVPALGDAPIRAAVRKVGTPGRSGRVSLKEGATEYLLDPLPAAPGKRRGYLVRVRPGSS